MTSSQAGPSFENLLVPTRIYLFGRAFSSIEYKSTSTSASGSGGADAGSTPPVSPVARSLSSLGDRGRFARVYGFSFEGHYYKLSRPALFLVDGDGRPQGASEGDAGDASEFSTAGTGIEGKDWQFSSDIRVWMVDKYDVAVRLDIEVGTYDDVLLKPLVAGPGESASSDRASARNAADFRGWVVGPHQAR